MALEAAQRLADEGVDVEVVDIRSLVPFDEETVLESVRSTGRVVITHEAVLPAGFGAEISLRIADQAFRFLDAPVKRVAAYDAPTPFAPTLESAILPSAAKIEAAIRETLAF